MKSPPRAGVPITHGARRRTGKPRIFASEDDYPFGCEVEPHPRTYQREVDDCRRWLQRFARHKATANKWIGSSYKLKHDVEDWLSIEGADDSYVTNGAFIAAAVLEGYWPQVIEGGPNCHFNMKSSYEKWHVQYCKKKARKR